MIDVDILYKFGGEQKKCKKNEIIFVEGQYPLHYYQILEGKVKMNNYSEDGKEFIQNIFSSGQSFGEPPLFIDEPYPANAVAITKAKLIQLPKASFDLMLETYPKVSIDVNRSLAHRLYYKSIMAPEISSQDSEKRLMTLFDYLKAHQGKSEDEVFLIPMTRQQLADLTGLRVETVIRTVKLLEKRGLVQIKDRKIYL